jgi:hypothetical protein
MMEQIPEAWVGQGVTVFFGQEGNRQGGTLVSVSERDIVVRSARDMMSRASFGIPSAP